MNLLQSLKALVGLYKQPTTAPCEPVEEIPQPVVEETPMDVSEPIITLANKILNFELEYEITERCNDLAGWTIRYQFTLHNGKAIVVFSRYHYDKKYVNAFILYTYMTKDEQKYLGEVMVKFWDAIEDKRVQAERQALVDNRVKLSKALCVNNE